MSCQCFISIHDLETFLVSWRLGGIYQRWISFLQIIVYHPFVARPNEEPE